MTDKNKKRILIAGLGVICIGLAVGIGSRLYRGGNEVVPVVEEEAGQEDEVIIAEPFVEVEPVVKEEMVIEAEEFKVPDETEQAIQTGPVKTEDAKPTEAPAVVQGTDTTNQNQKPADQEAGTTKTTAPSNNSPKTGDTKDGMVYVEGFGWVVDEGSGSGIFDNQMYENGNKIGIMD